jgi:anti-sigma factor RsiW
MTVDNTPVTPDELHAFVDGELPADRQDAVNSWLATHPDDAALVAAWRAQADAIRARYGAVVDEKVPERLALDKVLRNGGRGWRGIAAAAAAAAIMAFVIGGVAGWMARGASAAAPSDFDSFTNDALAAHRLYIGEVRHPIEVGATEAHLLPWLSRRVGTAIRAPELAPFDLKLLGGRLLPGMHGPAALFMYESASGERVTLYCSKLNLASTGLRYNENEKFAAVHWIEGGYGYVVSGPIDKARLKQIARNAYEQMENRSPPPPQNKASFLDQLMSRRGS